MTAFMRLSNSFRSSGLYARVTACHNVAAVLLALGLAGCGSDSTGPQSTRERVTVRRLFADTSTLQVTYSVFERTQLVARTAQDLEGAWRLLYQRAPNLPSASDPDLSRNFVVFSVSGLTGRQEGMISERVDSASTSNGVATVYLTRTLQCGVYAFPALYSSVDAVVIPRFAGTVVEFNTRQARVGC